jgi:hypothetical protein
MATSPRNPNGKREYATRDADLRAREFLGATMLDMARVCLQLQGVKTEGLSQSQIARLAFNRDEIIRRTGNVNLYASTADFPNILADMINKEVGTAYQLSPDTTQWCRSRPIRDFKIVSTVKLSAVPALTQLPAGAEYSVANIGDSGEKYVLAKYGKIIEFNWETILNDDLQQFATLPVMMGNAAMQTKLDVVYAVLTANPTMSDSVALFHADHSNLITGALSITSWGAAKAAMAKQTSNGQLLNAAPRHLLVPVELESAAANIVFPNALLQAGGGIATTQQNPYAGTVDLHVEPRLSLNSAVKWYAASDPQRMDTVEIAYLEGEPDPVVEQEDGFSIDGRRLKVRYCVAAKAADYRGLLRSSGV